ncbi:MAG: hypothetical protein ABI726_03515 [bacterium]
MTPIIVILCAFAAPPAAMARSVDVVDRLKADAGDGVTLFANDDFKVTGKCEDNGGGDFTANTFLAAKRANLAYDLYGAGVDPDFDPADGKIDITFGDATGTMPVYEAAEYYDFYAEGRNGRPLNGRLVTGVHVKGADCTFSGTVVGAESKGAVHAPKRVKADAGESVTIFSNDDFKVTGECQDNGGGDFTANTFLSAKHKHLVYYLTELDQFDTAFGPGDGKIDFVKPSDDANGTIAEYIGESFTHDLWTEGAGGKVLQGRVATGVHIKGADCTFSGLFVGYGTSKQMKVVDRIKADGGDGVTVFANDDFKVTGKCEDNGGGDFTANTFLAAKRQNLIYYAYDGDPFFILDFDPGDGKIDISEGYDATGTAPSYAAEDDYADFVGEGKSGRILAGRVGTGVNIKGADCTFAGIFIG